MQRIYVGTYTRPCDSQGIYQLALNHDGSLTDRKLLAEADNPSFLDLHPTGRFAYVVNELNDYQGQNQGAVTAFEVEADAPWRSLGQLPTFGAHPCHITVDSNGKWVVVANYSGGNLALYPIQADGSLGECCQQIQHTGSGPREDRQANAHVHSVNLSPDGHFLFVCDLGIDSIKIYELGEAGLSLFGERPTAPGAGPRHFTFHPNNRFAYVINELDSTITAYNCDTGTLSEINTLSTLAPTFTEKNICADVHVTPDGRFLYGTNRGDNSIACFAIDADTGAIAFVERVPTEGDHPRNFAITADGRYVLVANQNSNNIVTFSVDPTSGRLTASSEFELSMPVCVKLA